MFSFFPFSASWCLYTQFIFPLLNIAVVLDKNLKEESTVKFCGKKVTTTANVANRNNRFLIETCFFLLFIFQKRFVIKWN